MGHEPAVQGLVRGRLNVERPRGPEHRHEDLGVGDLTPVAGSVIGDLVAAEVDEGPFPGRVAEPGEAVAKWSLWAKA